MTTSLKERYDDERRCSGPYNVKGTAHKEDFTSSIARRGYPFRERTEGLTDDAFTPTDFDPTPSDTHFVRTLFRS